jgi:hypothetical protein
MGTEKEKESSRAVYVMTASGLQELPSSARSYTSLLKGTKIDSSAFLEALSSAIRELEAELDSKDE